jgi:hypothetical protein
MFSLRSVQRCYKHDKLGVAVSNCKFVDVEEPHPSNYRGCRQTKEEVRKRKSQRGPKYSTGRRVFSSSHTIPGLSFVAALSSNTQQQQQPQRPQPTSVAQACPATVGETSAHPLKAQPTSTNKSVSSGSQCKQFVSETCSQ